MDAVQRTNALLPSEIARLVLGYLAQHQCTKARRHFLKESTQLSEYRSLLAAGYEYPQTINAMSLIDMLQEYSRLKAQANTTTVNAEQPPRIQLLPLQGPSTGHGLSVNQPPDVGAFSHDLTSDNTGSSDQSPILDELDTLAQSSECNQRRKNDLRSIRVSSTNPRKRRFESTFCNKKRCVSQTQPKLLTFSGDAVTPVPPVVIHTPSEVVYPCSGKVSEMSSSVTASRGDLNVRDSEQLHNTTKSNRTGFTAEGVYSETVDSRQQYDDEGGYSGNDIDGDLTTCRLSPQLPTLQHQIDQPLQQLTRQPHQQQLIMQPQKQRNVQNAAESQQHHQPQLNPSQQPPQQQPPHQQPPHQQPPHQKLPQQQPPHQQPHQQQPPQQQQLLQHQQGQCSPLQKKFRHHSRKSQHQNRRQQQQTRQEQSEPTYLRTVSSQQHLAHHTVVQQKDSSHESGSQLVDTQTELSEQVLQAPSQPPGHLPYAALANQDKITVALQQQPVEQFQSAQTPNDKPVQSLIHQPSGQPLPLPVLKNQLTQEKPLNTGEEVTGYQPQGVSISSEPVPSARLHGQHVQTPGGQNVQAPTGSLNTIHGMNSKASEPPGYNIKRRKVGLNLANNGKPVIMGLSDVVKSPTSVVKVTRMGLSEIVKPLCQLTPPQASNINRELQKEPGLVAAPDVVAESSAQPMTFSGMIPGAERIRTFSKSKESPAKRKSTPLKKEVIFQDSNSLATPPRLLSNDGRPPSEIVMPMIVERLLNDTEWQENIAENINKKRGHTLESAPTPTGIIDFDELLEYTVTQTAGSVIDHRVDQDSNSVGLLFSPVDLSLPEGISPVSPAHSVSDSVSPLYNEQLPFSDQPVTLLPQDEQVLLGSKNTTNSVLTSSPGQAPSLQQGPSRKIYSSIEILESGMAAPPQTVLNPAIAHHVASRTSSGPSGRIRGHVSSQQAASSASVFQGETGSQTASGMSSHGDPVSAPPAKARKAAKLRSSPAGTGITDTAADIALPIEGEDSQFLAQVLTAPHGIIPNVMYLYTEDGQLQPVTINPQQQVVMLGDPKLSSQHAQPNYRPILPSTNNPAKNSGPPAPQSVSSRNGQQPANKSIQPAVTLDGAGSGGKAADADPCRSTALASVPNASNTVTVKEATLPGDKNMLAVPGSPIKPSLKSLKNTKSPVRTLVQETAVSPSMAALVQCVSPRKSSQNVSKRTLCFSPSQLGCTKTHSKTNISVQSKRQHASPSVATSSAGVWAQSPKPVRQMKSNGPVSSKIVNPLNGGGDTAHHSGASDVDAAQTLMVLSTSPCKKPSSSIVGTPKKAKGQPRSTGSRKGRPTNTKRLKGLNSDKMNTLLSAIHKK